MPRAARKVGGTVDIDPKRCEAAAQAARTVARKRGIEELAEPIVDELQVIGGDAALDDGRQRSMKKRALSF